MPRGLPSGTISALVWSADHTIVIPDRGADRKPGWSWVHCHIPNWLRGELPPAAAKQGGGQGHGLVYQLLIVGDSACPGPDHT